MASQLAPKQPVKIFYSYAHQDRQLKEKLAIHLRLLKQQGFMTDWGNQDIKPGQEWRHEIDKNLVDADIILLLVSPNFMASNYCETPEVDVAIQRHDAGDAWVIPIILRAADWDTSSIGKLQALPREPKPVSEWTHRDHILAKIAKDIRSLVIDLYRTKNNLIDPDNVENKKAHINIVNELPRKRKKRDLYKAIKRAKDERSIGEKIQDILYPIRYTFSMNALLKRSKGLSLLLLFSFGVLDTVVLPYLIYQWTESLFALLIAFFITLMVFIVGVTNKNNNVISIIASFIYFASWLIIQYFMINYKYHLNISFFLALLISFIVSVMQLMLFRSPYRKRSLTFFSKS